MNTREQIIADFVDGALDYEQAFDALVYEGMNPNRAAEALEEEPQCTTASASRQALQRPTGKLARAVWDARGGPPPSEIREYA